MLSVDGVTVGTVTATRQLNQQTVCRRCRAKTKLMSRNHHQAGNTTPSHSPETDIARPVLVDARRRQQAPVKVERLGRRHDPDLTTSAGKTVAALTLSRLPPLVATLTTLDAFR